LRQIRALGLKGRKNPAQGATLWIASCDGSRGLKGRRSLSTARRLAAQIQPKAQAMSESSFDRNPVEKIAAEFAERVRRGERPSITGEIKRFPELADDIRELLPVLAMVEQFKPEAHESAATADHGGRSPSDNPQ
jgi:hypothetical protein